MSLRTFSRITTPVIAFGVGFAFFPSEWRLSKWGPQPDYTVNHAALARIEQSEMYQRLDRDPAHTKRRSSDTFPVHHRHNYVSLGLLYGQNLFEVDPVSFCNEQTGELTAFYHLGGSLLDTDGYIHNGVTATILDEGLCSCGFARLPSKRGVTASLSIDFLNQAPPNCTLILEAKVASSKGRKVTIEGHLSTMGGDGKPGLQIAHATCVLVEPRWFKYFAWLHLT